MRRLVTLSILLLAGGCRQSVLIEPEGSPTVLVGVAVSWADSVFVVLAEGEPGTPEVTASEMELRSGGFVVPLERGPDDGCGGPPGLACYRAELGGRVEAGQDVDLVARLSDGRLVTGRATTPLVPPLTVGEAVPGDTVRVRLQDRIGGGVPELLGLDEVATRVTSPDVEAPATVWAGEEVLRCVVRRPISPDLDLRQADRVGVTADEPTCPGHPEIVWDSLAMPATFMVYDENFTAWAEVGRAVAGVAGFGLEGMAGVFGAGTPVTFIVLATP